MVSNVPFVQIENMDEVLRKLDKGTLIGEPLRRFWTRVCIDIQSRARDKAPRDTGLLAASIVYEVDPSEVPQQAVVGSETHYAPYMEYGTGALGDPDAPYSHMAGHWPPGEALEVWAGTHGFSSGYAIAAAIGKRGGLSPRRFLRDAVAAVQERMNDFLAQLANEIGAEWSR